MDECIDIGKLLRTYITSGSFEKSISGTEMLPLGLSNARLTPISALGLKQPESLLSPPSPAMGNHYYR